MKSTAKKIVTFAILLHGYSCASSDDRSSHTQSIIGENDLKDDSDRNLEERIGLLTDGKINCTAFFSDVSQITTAAHCVEGQKISGFTFRIKNQPIGFKVKIKKIYSNVDIALLTVEGKNAQKLDLARASDKYVKFVGFDAQKKRLVTHENCEVSRDFSRPSLLTHNCDSFEGMSGGVLIQQGRVVGIHLGSIKSQKVNVAFDASVREMEKLKINRQEIAVEAFGLGKCVPWCPGDEGKIFEKIPPLKLPGLNPQWSGYLIGGPLGLLLNDKLAMEQKLREMREAGAQREADFLELKSRLSDMAKERDGLKNQIACESARSGFLPALEASYNAFVASLQNADSEESANRAWENYQRATEALFDVARTTCN